MLLLSLLTLFLGPLLLVGLRRGGSLASLIDRAVVWLLAPLVLLLLVPDTLYAPASLDGAGLAGAELLPGVGLEWAIILHRVGVGLMLWLIVQPIFGNARAWLVLLLMAGATLLGFEFSERLLPLAGETSIAALQALIVGTILHGVVHRGHVGHDHPHS